MGRCDHDKGYADWRQTGSRAYCPPRLSGLTAEQFVTIWREISGFDEDTAERIVHGFTSVEVVCSKCGEVDEFLLLGDHRDPPGILKIDGPLSDERAEGLRRRWETENPTAVDSL